MWKQGEVCTVYLKQLVFKNKPKVLFLALCSHREKQFKRKPGALALGFAASLRGEWQASHIYAEPVRTLSSLEPHTVTGQEADISLQYSETDGMSLGTRVYG